MEVALVTAGVKDGGIFGAENLYVGLEGAIREAGHNIKTFPMTIDETTWEGVLEGYLKCYDLDLEDFDLVISTKAPTYMLRHRYHVSYLLHTMRVFYDMFDKEFPRPTPRIYKQQKLIHAFDNYGLAPERIKRHYTIGNEVARRLKKWNGINAAVMHPSPHLSDYRCEEFRHIFMPGRLHRWKRPDLMIKAMKYIDADVELLIAGTGADEALYREMARDDRRIRFLGYVDDETMLELYANALVVPFLPIREDYGLITIEAMKSKKPVITCDDSGEPLSFVRDGETGYVTPPEPEAIAARISHLVKNPHEARTMGERGYDETRHICWENLLRKLVDEHKEKALAASGSRKTKVLVTDNQMLTPAVGGGRIRVLYLYKDLPPEYDVTYVGAYDHPGPEYREQRLTDNFSEIVVPLTQVHFKIDSFLRKLARNKVIIDVTIPLLMRFSPRFLEKVNHYSSKARIVIISHPWVAPWVENSTDQLLVYDSHNHEFLVKKQILSDTLFGKLLVRVVRKTEKDLCEKADLVIACSPLDKENYSDLYGIPADKIRIVPNGVSTSEIRPASPSAALKAKSDLGLDAGTVVLFIGSGYGPNTDGLKFIAEQLAPKLPECYFAVMGGVKDSYLRESGRKESDLPSNVRLFGVVDSLERDRLYAAADIAINPMFRGSGVNIKMLDYFAAGLPVVSTPVGARGLDVESGMHGIICEPEDFAANIKRLAEDAGLGAELGANARKLAEEKYDWKVIAEGMLRHIAKAFAKKKLLKR